MVGLYTDCIFLCQNFYKDEINREEMYIRYVNKLHELHMVAGNHVEAGLTLQLYANVLAWSQRVLPAEMRYRQERECDRHEMLYTQIINCFDKGKVSVYVEHQMRCIILTLNLPYKLSSVIFLDCFNIQSASLLLKV